MNTLNTEPTQRPLRTSDLAAAGSRTAAAREEREAEMQDVVVSDARVADARDDRERLDSNGRVQLDPLFSTDLADEYRARWTAVQGSFVDDPRQAVQQGDELVAQVMKSLAESFAHEREALENQLSGGGEASTEMLRVALRRYRSFFERLLSL
jgi:inorganic triphosphatase YgiF